MGSLSENSSMTTSQFMEQVKYNAALENELARTIAEISTIDTVRVHLAAPKQSVFVRDRQPAKASVVVKPIEAELWTPGKFNLLFIWLAPAFLTWHLRMLLSSIT